MLVPSDNSKIMENYVLEAIFLSVGTQELAQEVGEGEEGRNGVFFSSSSFYFLIFLVQKTECLKRNVGGAHSSFGIWYTHLEQVKVIFPSFSLYPFSLEENNQ